MGEIQLFLRVLASYFRLIGLRCLLLLPRTMQTTLDAATPESVLVVWICLTYLAPQLVEVIFREGNTEFRMRGASTTSHVCVFANRGQP
jgi:hypothetical protein